MSCDLYFIRDEDKYIEKLVEDGSKILVLGLHRSGVSSLLKRINRIGNRQTVLYMELPNNIDEDKYIILDAKDLNTGLNAYNKYENILVGISVDLIELIGLPRKLYDMHVRAIVLKPLTPIEVYEYLFKLGVKGIDENIIEEFLYRTGGFPGDICKIVVEYGLRGSFIHKDVLNDLNRDPPWLIKAIRDMDDGFDRFAKDILIGYFNDKIIKEFNIMIDSPWIVKGREGYYIWPELLWLQPYIAMYVGPDYILDLYPRLVQTFSDPYMKYIYLSTLYKYDKKYSKELVEVGWNAFKSVEDPIIKFKIARRLAQIAESIGMYELESDFLNGYASNLINIEVTKEDLSWLINRFRMINLESKNRYLQKYVDTLCDIAFAIYRWRTPNLFPIIISELERLIWDESLNDDIRRYTEYIYLITESLNKASLKLWSDVSRNLDYIWNNIAILNKKAYLNILPIYLESKIALGKYEEAYSILDILNYDKLNTDEFKSLKYLLDFFTIKPYKLKSFLDSIPKEIDLTLMIIFALSFLAYYGHIDLDPKYVNYPIFRLIYVLEKIYSHKLGEVASLMRKIGNIPYEFIYLLFDIAYNLSLPSGTDWISMKKYLDNLLGYVNEYGISGLKRLVRELNEYIDNKDIIGVRLSISKLLLYTLYY